MNDDSVNSGRKTGRPKKGDPPRISYEEVDRLLVFGEVVATEDGKSTTVVYPTYRDLARRFGVSHSLVAQYGRKHNCQRRKEVAQARIAAKADQKLVEIRSTAIALSKDDALRMIDTYLMGFEKALAEERVRFDNPSDFNTMLRLKEFILGGADSRQEVHASLSLEDIQARHQKMLRADQEMSEAERGLDTSVCKSLPERNESNRDLSSNSPDFQTDPAVQEVNGQFLVTNEKAPVAAHVRPCRADLVTTQDDSGSFDEAPRGRGVARTAPSAEEDDDEE